MSKKIYKYGIDPRNLNERQDVTMPAGAALLDTAPQLVMSEEGPQPQLSVWAEVDTTNPPRTYPFMVVYTGDDVPGDDWTYWKTLSVGNGVYHVYVAPQINSEAN